MAEIFNTFKKGARALRDYNSLDFFPLPAALAGYKPADITSDFRAGINVALLAFPQGMAYALIAGLPIQYGIYGSAIAALFGPVFAKSRFITLGPTNATSVMLLSAFASLGVAGPEKLALVPLLILLVGLFLVVGAYLGLAGLVQYISRSVITGYISAAALLIITNQIPKTLGLEIEGKGATFFESLNLMVAALPTINWTTVGVSAATAGIFIALSRKFRALPNVAITLVLISLLAIPLLGKDSNLVYLTGINAANWSFHLPSVSVDSLRLLAGPALAIALLCVLEGISIGKSLAAKTGARLDVDQAMFSIGMSNIGCAFFSGMPASGSLTRSSLCEHSGARSPLASFFSGMLVFGGAFLLGPYTGYIPQCALAVLVIAIGISLINSKSIRIVTHATRSDAAVFIVTFCSGMVLPLDTAIYIGVGTSIALFLKKVAQPEMVEYAFNDRGELAQLHKEGQREIPEVSIVHVEGELFFGAADLFRDQMRRICEDPNLKVVILKMRNAHNMDATGVMALEELMRYMSELGRYLILSEAKEDLVRVLKNARLFDEIEERNVFPDDPSNPTLSTARALKRAKEHLGDTEANVSIYVDKIRDARKKGDRPEGETSP